jgi:hypothetical protein
MFTTRALRPLILAAAMLISPFGQAQVLPSNASLYLNAEAGNYVSYELAGPVTWRHGADGTMFGNDHISRANDGVNLFFERGNDLWLMQFTAPRYDARDGSYDGQPLQIGLYDNVSGDWRDDPNRAGMLISSPLGSVIEWSGWFRVLDIAYAANGDLSRFAVDFMQYDTLNQSGPSLSGSLRYNSAIALVEVPEPGTLVLVLAGLGLLCASSAHKRKLRAS